MEKYPVIVVGAGPVGMVCALALNKRGIPVKVFEKEPGPVRDQRAASIHPPTLEMLDDLGVTQRIIPKGLVSSKYRYHDRLSGKVVAEFDLSEMKGEFQFPFVLQYEQYKLTGDIASEYAVHADFQVQFGAEVVSVTPLPDRVELQVKVENRTETVVGSYVIGADGGRSTVRRQAKIPFEGFTYQEKFIKIATTFDFSSAHPEVVYRNYFSDPNEWCNLFKVRGEQASGLWRAILPLRPDESEEAASSPGGIEERLQRFFPKEGKYEVEYSGIYSVSQRVAAKFREGRILLVGDAAHVNNPIGGMGMNGGIHDAINLADKLSQIYAGDAAPDLLDLYSRQRRHAAVEYVQAQTIANKKLLEEHDIATRSKKLDELKRVSETPSSARQYMRRAALLESLQTAAAVS